MADKKSLRIVYMGTPDFAVEPLKALINNDYNIVGVITNYNKPSGRGQRITESAVKVFARENNLKVLQPQNLKAEEFLAELKALNADLQIIVAFRMLPEVVWDMPRLGTFNLHASLLPQYRGAAPINWAVINGDKETGATTFFLQHKIDTGNIILQNKVEILDEDTAGTVHDKLMYSGADLVVQTVDRIISGNIEASPQKIINENELKAAPKIFKEDCKINWNSEGASIYNKIRGLSPYPAAWSEFINEKEKVISFKIFDSEYEKLYHTIKIGTIFTDKKTELKIAVKNGYIQIKEIQIAGKKRMKIGDFLRGYQNIDNLRIF